MDQFTREVLEKKFKKLKQGHSDLFRFNSLEDFVAEFEGQWATPGDGIDNRVTRIDSSLLFESGNVKLIALPPELSARDLELSKYSYPTI